VVAKPEGKEPFGKTGNDTALIVVMLTVFKWLWIR
jgi:hypothetical protein